MKRRKAKPGPIIDGMKIPAEWFHLFAGDRIHTTLPYHRITSAAESMQRDGWKFETEPSPRGYWLICRESPLRTGDLHWKPTRRTQT